MLKLEDDLKVYLYTRPCDMRRGFDVLARQVEEHFKRSVCAGGIFVFFSRSRERAKVLYWDKDGYALWYKRLEHGVFRISSESETEEITGVDLRLLLEGMDLKRIKFRKVASGIAELRTS
jgi:transposase